ncbi:MAG: hypothetical protein HOJ34_11935 [Kordiimonadaceae bacterium]|nr:hypothetical protein [Kordiimonadaceae bacterium]MBT6330480.1 hypothetical protein [Kordiimonadaceae bacterium]MBT7581492.1 hypothetical protein [Kordiimonadaceae bacterium]
MNKILNILSVCMIISLSASCAQTVKQVEITRTTERHQSPFGNLEITPYYGNVVYAAQPDEDTVKMFKDQDFDLVINIRELDEEIGFDERKLVEDQGITYLTIPYMTEPTTRSDFSHDALSQIKQVIDDATAKGQKIMLHCSHGQRAGSSLGMILYRDYGYSKEEAFKAATDAGMNSKWAVPRFWKFIESSIVKVKPIDGIKNMVKYKNFYIASQPSPEAIKKLKEMGVTTVITNRAKTENGGFEEQKAVEDAGLKFHRARIYNDRYGDINDQKINMDELEKALGIIASTTDGDVFVHCGSGDRASIILATHLFNVDQNSEREALSKARLAGLRNANITKQLEDYMGAPE